MRIRNSPSFGGARVSCSPHRRTRASTSSTTDGSIAGDVRRLLPTGLLAFQTDTTLRTIWEVAVLPQGAGITSA